MASVNPRVSKKEFILALGLNPHDAQHEHYYRAMRDETILVYNRMNKDTSHLLDSVRTDPNTRPPFFWHHIIPERQTWAISEIYRLAGPITRPLLDRGRTIGKYGPNWVAGWLLYSIFRSRDVRNNRNRRKGGKGAGRGIANEKVELTEEAASPKRMYYDPVRNRTA
ncbi:hypothetical protein N7533_013753 [Penicillium manginii]|uniref:uncharacterized protein n=1 Tax=Penicillium manginii TaxID=203109 RepID=UPI0025474D12|nr:uncharacterized protein N7533_013753 [Penicillium manginii]KAJ5733306.1 hypothetical protein N7533_013753 [Penicillium manginii]